MTTLVSKKPVTYRVATLADATMVVQLLSELVEELAPEEPIIPKLPEDIAKAFASPQIRIFLAEQGKETLGVSRADILSVDPIFRLRDENRCGYIDQMFVRKPYRNLQVGARLLQLCEEWFREQGLEHCLLHAAPKAVRFYARTGYHPNREMCKQL